MDSSITRNVIDACVASSPEDCLLASWQYHCDCVHRGPAAQSSAPATAFQVNCRSWQRSVLYCGTHFYGGETVCKLVVEPIHYRSVKLTRVLH